MNNRAGSNTVEMNGYALREIRKLHNLTPRQVADEIGRDRSYIAKIELGHSRVSVDTFDRIVKALAIEDRRALLATPHAPVAVAS